MRVVLVREAYARSHGAIAVTTAYIMIRFGFDSDSSNGARLVSRGRARTRARTPLARRRRACRASTCTNSPTG